MMSRQKSNVPCQAGRLFSPVINSTCSTAVVGTDPDKQYISLYRSLAGIWIIFALAWLALVLNMGARIMETVVLLTHPGFMKRKEEEDVSASKLEDMSKV